MSDDWVSDKKKFEITVLMFEVQSVIKIAGALRIWSVQEVMIECPLNICMFTDCWK